MAWYITKLVVDLPWPGGGCEVFLLASGGAKHFLVGFRGGGKAFFCPADVIFISDHHVINVTSLMPILVAGLGHCLDSVPPFSQFGLRLVERSKFLAKKEPSHCGDTVLNSIPMLP